MTDLDIATIPRVTLVVNRALGMTEGKALAQAFQAAERLHRALDLHTGPELTTDRFRLMEAWREHTTTIAREATTQAMFERVCAEVPGVLMVDEGFTEVEPDTPTCFATWPATPADEHKLLSNAKVKLMRNVVQPFGAWSDEQIIAVAAAMAGAPGGHDADTEVLEMLRTVAASRKLHLPSPGGALVSHENWLPNLDVQIRRGAA
jgi:peptidyl-tRNA hydrolase